jgi:hypothetical protein
MRKRRPRYRAGHGRGDTRVGAAGCRATRGRARWQRRHKHHCPHKAILGTAYEFATGHRLAPGDFEGGKSGAVKVLGNLGFTVQPL